MNKLQRYIITAAITAIVAFLIWYFGNIVKYVLVSAVLSWIGKPLVDVLCRIRIRGRAFPKWLAATVALVAMWGISTALMWFFIPLVVSKINALSGYNFAEFVNAFSDSIRQAEVYLHDRFAIDLTSGGKSLTEVLRERSAEMLTPSIIGIGALLDTLTAFVIGAFSVSFITFFFMKENDLFDEGVIILFPRKYEPNVRRALVSSITLLSRYFIGILIESSIKLLVISVCLYILGLSASDALIIALISAVLNVIPYIGPLIGAVAGIIIGIVGSSGTDAYTLMWQMASVFALFQLIDNIILQPYIYSSSVRAHPLEIFLVILLAGSIAGVTGMLLAIPAYTVLRVFAKEFFNNLRVVQKLTEHI